MSTNIAIATPGPLRERNRFQRSIRPLLRLARRKPLGAFGLTVLIILGVLAVFAPLIATHSTTQLYEPRVSPGSTHYFGTDGIGRDVFSRVVMGSRVTLVVAFSAVAISMSIATFLGVVSGYFRGPTEMIIQRAVDVLMSLPWLVVLLSLMALLGRGITQLVLAIALLSAAGSVRVVRSAVIGIRENAYLEAARAVGADHPRIIFRHVLPNVFPPVVIAATLALGNVILTETALSFLGYGIPAPTPSWGRMLGPDAKGYLVIAPWIAIFPGLAISLTVFAFNMFGDALRDILDPRLRT